MKNLKKFGLDYNYFNTLINRKFPYFHTQIVDIP